MFNSTHSGQCGWQVRMLCGLFFVIFWVSGAVAALAQFEPQRYTGENFDPSLCDTAPEDVLAFQIGDTVFDIPKDRFDLAFPTHFSVLANGKNGSIEYAPIAPDALCPGKPLQANIVVIRKQIDGDLIRYILRENSTENRIKKRRDMLMRMRAQIDCPVLGYFVVCAVTERGGQEQVAYMLPKTGEVLLKSGQVLHVRCTAVDQRCAVYDEIAPRQAFIETLVSDANSLRRK